MSNSVIGDRCSLENIYDDGIHHVGIHINKGKISVFHERPVTRNEKKKDPEATLMCEVINIRFSKNKKPKIAVNCDLCS